MTKNDERRELLAGNPGGLNERAQMNPGDSLPAGAASAGQETCPACGGSGRAADGGSCITCGGSGRVEVPVSAGD